MPRFTCTLWYEINAAYLNGFNWMYAKHLIIIIICIFNMGIFHISINAHNFRGYTHVPIFSMQQMWSIYFREYDISRWRYQTISLLWVMAERNGCYMFLIIGSTEWKLNITLRDKKAIQWKLDWVTHQLHEWIDQHRRHYGEEDLHSGSTLQQWKIK